MSTAYMPSRSWLGCLLYPINDKTAILISTRRVEGASINDDAMYTLESIEVFKGDSSADSIYAAGETFDIIMAGNGALCGIFLQLEQELLIDLSEDDDGNLNGVGLCGLTSSWDAVTTEDMAVLEEGCDDYDPCDGACSEFQVLQYVKGGHQGR